MLAQQSGTGFSNIQLPPSVSGLLGYYDASKVGTVTIDANQKVTDLRTITGEMLAIDRAGQTDRWQYVVGSDGQYLLESPIGEIATLNTGSGAYSYTGPLTYVCRRQKVDFAVGAGNDDIIATANGDSNLGNIGERTRDDNRSDRARIRRQNGNATNVNYPSTTGPVGTSFAVAYAQDVGTVDAEVTTQTTTQGSATSLTASIPDAVLPRIQGLRVQCVDTVHVRISDILFYNRVLSLAEREDIVGWLLEKRTYE